MKKTLLSVAMVAALSAGSAQAEFLDFTMNYGSVPEFTVNPYEVVADKLNGGYGEIVNLTPTANPANFNYQATAYIDFASVFKNEGATLTTGFGGDETISPAGFAMYAVFNSTGTYNSGVFSGQTGTFDLFIDVDQDTGKTFDMAGVLSLTSTADDYKIATASLMDYLIGTPFVVPGAYDTVFSDFTLTTGDQSATFAGDQNGDLFFVAPRPFHLTVRSNGDFDQFITPVVYPGLDGVLGTADDITNPLQIKITGDASAVFQIPEPSTVALLGLGLTGLGLSLRRRKTA